MPVSCSNSGRAGRMISLVQSWLLTRKRICLPLNRFQSNVPWAVTGDGRADIQRRLAPKSAMRVAMMGRGDLSMSFPLPEPTERRAGPAGVLVGDGARRRHLRGRAANGPRLALGPGPAPVRQ